MKIGTHSGAFHADESLACFMLKNTKLFKDAEIVRTRDPKELETCDIVVDVGGVYDPTTHRYDHHQREFQDTMTIGDMKYEIRLSSAGLVYRHFGLEVLKNIISKSNDKLASNEDKMALLYRKMYEEFVEAFDGIDNGVDRYPNDIKPKYKDSTNLASRVSALLPKWNEDADDFDQRFKKAVELVGLEFSEKLSFLAFSWLPARDIVRQAIEDRFNVDESGKIIKLPISLPWKESLFALEEEKQIQNELLYVVYPENKTPDAFWRIQAVPLSLNGFQNRKPLPESWRGIRDDLLSDFTGIQGCIFVHASGFIGGNKTLTGALEMARSGIKN